MQALVIDVYTSMDTKKNNKIIVQNRYKFVIKFCTIYFNILNAIKLTIILPILLILGNFNMK